MPVQCKNLPKLKVLSCTKLRIQAKKLGVKNHTPKKKSFLDKPSDVYDVNKTSK